MKVTRMLRSACAVILASSLLSGSAAYPQSTATDPATTEQKYQKLFTAVGAFMVQVTDVCKSADCAFLAEQGTRIVKDGQTKHAKGVLVGADLLQFHKNIEANLSKVMQALTTEADNQDAVNRLDTKRALEACNKKRNRLSPVGYGCDQVFAAAMAICSLYLIASPIAAALCTAAAIYAYNKCLKNEAATQVPPQN